MRQKKIQRAQLRGTLQRAIERGIWRAERYGSWPRKGNDAFNVWGCRAVCRSAYQIDRVLKCDSEIQHSTDELTFARGSKECNMEIIIIYDTKKT